MYFPNSAAIFRDIILKKVQTFGAGEQRWYMPESAGGFPTASGGNLPNRQVHLAGAGSTTR